MEKVQIRDVKVICCAPQGINLVTVKVETSEPGLYGVGCATFAHRHLAVVTAVEIPARPAAPTLTDDMISASDASLSLTGEDGVTYAILLMNAASWLLERFTPTRLFGAPQRKGGLR